MKPNRKSAITCITCPIGCRIAIDIDNDEYIFSGNKCKRGEEFARTELTSPVRSLTTTVRTAFDDMPVLPVRTRGEVPKGKIKEIMRELSCIMITERIGIGEIVAANILGTGCDIIAASALAGGNYDEHKPGCTYNRSWDAKR
jgi:CxxC motif-containing protein